MAALVFSALRVSRRLSFHHILALRRRHLRSLSLRMHRLFFVCFVRRFSFAQYKYLLKYTLFFLSSAKVDVVFSPGANATNLNLLHAPAAETCALRSAARTTTRGRGDCLLRNASLNEKADHQRERRGKHICPFPVEATATTRWQPSPTIIFPAQ